MFVLVSAEKCDHVFVGFCELTCVENKSDWFSACRDKINRLEAYFSRFD